nr:zinc-ribbon domain protein [uncultured bacterium]
MYCSSCGGVVARGVSFCKHCGVKLNGEKGESVVAKSPELFPDSLIWAIVSVFVVGLGCIIGLMSVMKKELGFNNGIIIAIALLSFLLLFMIEAVFVWLLWQRKREAKASDSFARAKEQTTKELDARSQARTLPQPVPSVTERTTRSFDPIYTERKAE